GAERFVSSDAVAAHPAGQACPALRSPGLTVATYSFLPRCTSSVKSAAQTWFSRIGMRRRRRFGNVRRDLDFQTSYASSCRCARTDRKSTRLNASHASNSYAVFCLEHEIKS